MLEVGAVVAGASNESEAVETCIYRFGRIGWPYLGRLFIEWRVDLTVV